MAALLHQPNVGPVPDGAAPLGSLMGVFQSFLPAIDTQPAGHDAARYVKKAYSLIGDFELEDKIETVMTQQLEMELMWPNSSICLPPLKTLSTKITWNTIIYDPMLPQELSEEADTPYIEHTSESGSVQLKPFGQAIRYNMESLVYTQGRAQFIASAMQLISNQHLLMAYRAIREALNYDSSHANFLAKYTTDRSWRYNMQRSVAQFAVAVKEKAGIFKAITDCTNELRNNGFTPTVVVMDHRKEALTTYGSNQTYDYSHGGLQAAKRLVNGRPITVIGDVEVRRCPTAPNFRNLSSIPVSLMDNIIQLGERYRIHMPNYERYVTEEYQGNFAEDYLDLEIFDERQDMYTVIRTADCIENLIAFYDHMAIMGSNPVPAQGTEDVVHDDNGRLRSVSDMIDVFADRFAEKTHVIRCMRERMRLKPDWYNSNRVPDVKRALIHLSQKCVLPFSIDLWRPFRLYRTSSVMAIAGGEEFGNTALHPVRFDNSEDRRSRKGFASLLIRHAIVIKDRRRVAVNQHVTFSMSYIEGSSIEFFSSNNFHQYVSTNKCSSIAPASLIPVDVAYDEREPREMFLDMSGSTNNYMDPGKHYSTCDKYRALFASLMTTNGNAFVRSGNRLCYRGNCIVVTNTPGKRDKRIYGNGHHGTFEEDGCVATTRLLGTRVYSTAP